MIFIKLYVEFRLPPSLGTSSTCSSLESSESEYNGVSFPRSIRKSLVTLSAHIPARSGELLTEELLGVVD